MTKQEATKVGREAGRNEFNRLGGPALVNKDNEPTADLGGLYGRIYSTVFFDAFKAEFMAAWRQAHEAIPEVKATRRAESIRSTIDYMKIAGFDCMDRFMMDVARNPFDAFESSDQAIAASAKRHVGAMLEAVLNHAEGGPEAAVAEACKEALRGAREPSRSTSVMSNLTDQLKTAAYAEFANMYRT